jgi:hypothetical protein
MKILSVEYLPRDLKIIAFIALILGALILFRYGISLQNLLLAVSPFTAAIVYFALSSGISKKEKWAPILGVIFFSLAIVNALINYWLGLISLFDLIIGLLIPVIFLFTFLKAIKELSINIHISIDSFVIVIIGIIFITATTIFTIYHHPRPCSNDLYSTEFSEKEKLIALTKESQKKLIKNINIQGDSALNQIADLKCLQFLNLEKAYYLSDISPLKNLTNLKELYLGPRISENSGLILKELKKLEVLNIQGSINIKDNSFIADLKNLKNLWLYEIKKEDIPLLKNLQKLEYLGWSKLSSTNCQEIKNSLPGVTIFCF